MGYRAKLIKIFTFLGGIYFFLEFVLPESIGGVKIDTFNDQISNGFTVIGAMALGLGLVNLLMVHGSKIIFRRRGWFDSAALLLGLALMTGVTAADWIRSNRLSEKVSRVLMLREFSELIKKEYEAKKPGVPAYWLRNSKLKDAAANSFSQIEQELAATPAAVASEGHADNQRIQVARQDLETALAKAKDANNLLLVTEAASPDFTANESLAPLLGAIASAKREFDQISYKHTRLKQCYEFMYQGLFVALGAAMFSLLGFYIAAAAYRAFRIKSTESALMMGAAVIVMLGQIPFGIWLWSALPDLRLWLLQVPNSGAFRAIKIGAAVAGLVMAFRMWFSIETESFAERTK